MPPDGASRRLPPPHSDAADDAAGADARPLVPRAGVVRLAAGLFLLGILAFYGLAQAKVITAVGGGTSVPGPEAILRRYHGDPDRSRLAIAIDPALDETDARRMYAFLGADEPARADARARILAWVEHGAPVSGWGDVAPVLTGEATCAACHSRADGGTRAKADLPFDRRDDVAPLAAPAPGISLAELTTTSHNHLFHFLVASLLTSILFATTRWRGPIVPLLVVGAFAGSLVDVAGWWLARAHGAPFHWLVLGGGAAFGTSLLAMCALTLDELWLGGRAGGLLERALRATRLGRRAPAARRPARVSGGSGT